VGGWLLLLAMLGLVPWGVVRLGTMETRWPTRASVLEGPMMSGLLLGVPGATTRRHAGGEGAVRFLQKVWLVQSGRPRDFWPG
jgi:hypothetical protein